jgi:hypothetical protein
MTFPAMAPSARPVTDVVYIGGSQRSGSTLLDRMLSQIPGHLSAGEVVHLWIRGVLHDELCGCGLAFSRCPFWSEVGRVAFGGWDRVPVDEVVALRRRVDRNRYIIFMLVPALWPRYRRDLRSYTDLLERLYGAIQQVGGGATVVDSSKHASTAFLLRRIAGLRLRVVHLVRDSRGVAYSLLKQVRRPEVVEADAFMQRTAPWRSGLEWLAFNGSFHVLRWFRTPSLLVRYEDLVRSPEATLRRIIDFEGRRSTAPEVAPTSAPPWPFIDGASVTLGVDHTVAGNPMRLKHGALQLSLDEAWKRSMRPAHRLVTTALTWPLLLAYGYRSSGKELLS